jgi:hypothetical protein
MLIAGGDLQTMIAALFRLVLRSSVADGYDTLGTSGLGTRSNGLAAGLVDSSRACQDRSVSLAGHGCRVLLMGSHVR